jgi:hypothetical protein
MTAHGLTIGERFESKYIPEPNSGCWLWMGARVSKGYGSIRIADKIIAAHRLSWKLHKGEIPENSHVLHTCDNPPCVNPDHLFLGTNDDNVQDKIAKGRLRCECGERRYNAKLTEELVRQIRSDPSISNKEWAKRLDVHYATIHHARTGKWWKHVQ